MKELAMAETAQRSDVSKIAALDPVWNAIRNEAEASAAASPPLGGFLYGAVLAHETLEDAICHRLSELLADAQLTTGALRPLLRSVLQSEPELGQAFRADLVATYDRDAACQRFIEPFLYFKGFHALSTHRFAHALLNRGDRELALFLQSQSSRNFSVDINPAAVIGKGLMFDHATGLVIGETARVGDNVSILHGVTLGGTGKETGDRHPKIGDNVLIGAGASILGNISVGHCSRVAAGSVVLRDVPPLTTVAGIPAKIVGDAGCPEPARTMDQLFNRGAAI